MSWATLSEAFSSSTACKSLQLGKLTLNDGRLTIDLVLNAAAVLAQSLCYAPISTF